MACTLNLFDYLGGSPDTGGEWVPGEPNGGNCSDIVNTNPSGLVPSAGYLGTLDADGATSGTYSYTYLVPAGGGACEDCAVVTVTINNGVVVVVNGTYCSGTTCTRIFCNDDSTDYNLYNEFINGTSTDGTWAVAPALSSPAYNPNTGIATDDTIRPSAMGVGTWVFTYTVNHGAGVGGGDPAPVGCTNCYAEITINIQVQEAPDAGTDGAVTMCN